MAQKGPFSSMDFDYFLDLKFWRSEILFLMSQTSKCTDLGLVKAMGEGIRPKKVFAKKIRPLKFEKWLKKAHFGAQMFISF